jgi:hypothetical protein
LRIVDRKGLEEAVCECYKAVSNECNGLVATNAEKYLSVCAKSRAELA